MQPVSWALALLLLLTSLSVPALTLPYQRKLLQLHQFDDGGNGNFNRDLSPDTYSNELEQSIQRQINQGTEYRDELGEEAFDEGVIIEKDIVDTTESIIPGKGALADLLQVQVARLLPPSHDEDAVGDAIINRSPSQDGGISAATTPSGIGEQDVDTTDLPNGFDPNMPVPGHLDSKASLDINLPEATTSAPAPTTPASTPVSLVRSGKLTADLTLQGLVENQMASYFPVTGDQKADQSASLVQKSFMTALKQDIGSIIHETWPPTEDTDDSVLGEGESDNPEENEDQFSPEDMKRFFAQYDFEVDAEMMQEKLLGLLQQGKQPTPTNSPNASGKNEIRVHHTNGHFHLAETTPTAATPTNHKNTCKHDLRAIFRKFDFEVDAEEVESQIHTLHEDFLSSKPNTSAGAPQQQAYLKVSGPARKQDGAKHDIDDVQGPPPVDYYDAQANEQLNNESVDEFYDRFIGMRGMVIQNVIVSRM